MGCQSIGLAVAPQHVEDAPIRTPTACDVVGRMAGTEEICRKSPGFLRMLCGGLLRLGRDRPPFHSRPPLREGTQGRHAVFLAGPARGIGQVCRHVRSIGSPDKQISSRVFRDLRGCSGVRWEGREPSCICWQRSFVSIPRIHRRQRSSKGTRCAEAFSLSRSPAFPLRVHNEQASILRRSRKEKCPSLSIQLIQVALVPNRRG
jgi:hypothetical protein